MNIPDLINGSFELLAAAAVLNNCWTVWQHKQVRGVSIASTAFFLLWGVWNLYYYPYLDQFFSFAGGIAITIANIIYVALLVRFGRHRRTPIYYAYRRGDGSYGATTLDEHALFGGYQDYPIGNGAAHHLACNHYGVETRGSKQ